MRAIPCVENRLNEKEQKMLKCPPVSGEYYSRARFTVRPVEETKEIGGTRLGKPFKKNKVHFW